MAPILVAYATKHGSTREVAEAVASELERHDLRVDVLSVSEVTNVTAYSGVVLGGALYTGRLHRDARRFLARHRAALARRPLAVFAMGPRTMKPDDVAGSHAQLDRALASVPELDPVAVAIFGGVVDPTALRFPFSRMPASDARDWDAIRAWADELAERLAATPRPAPARSPAGRTA